MNNSALGYELVDDFRVPSNQDEIPNSLLRNKETGSWIKQDQINKVKRFNDFTTIDWLEDELDSHKDRVSNSISYISRAVSLKQKIVSLSSKWVTLALVGITIGIIASMLNIITAWLSGIRTGHCKGHLYLSKAFCCWEEVGDTCDRWVEWTPYLFSNYIIYIISSLAFALTSGILVKGYAPSAAGSGISEIKCIISGFSIDGFLGWSTLLIKSLGLPLAIGSGLSVGKEGPSVHYAVCVGNCLSRLIKKYRKSASKEREFLTAGAAAGVAVAFGSPMGGVLFSIEEMSTVFQLPTIWSSYFCSLFAVSTLSAINPFRTGQLVMFEVSYDNQWRYFEIPAYVILGIFGGVYGIVVSKYNIMVVSFRKRFLSNFALREIALLALLSATISYFNEFLQLDMTESMQILFSECNKNFKHPICDSNSNALKWFFYLVVATCIRMIFTIITYGCKVPAGIFVPSMAAGATFGRALSIIMTLLHNRLGNTWIFESCKDVDKCIIPGTYAFLGAAATLSGITNLTVTVAIIMFELTGALKYMIPTLITIAITKIINDKWGKGGIADQMIEFNGLPLIDTKEEFSFNATVESAMSTALTSFPCDLNESLDLGTLRRTLEKTTYGGFPLFQSSSVPRIAGFVSRTDLDNALIKYVDGDELLCDFTKNSTASSSHVNFGAIVNRTPLTIGSNTRLEHVLDIFAKVGPRYLLVEKEGILVGIITRKDILRYHHTESAFQETVNNNDVLEERIWELMARVGQYTRHMLRTLSSSNRDRYMH